MVAPGAGPGEGCIAVTLHWFGVMVLNVFSQFFTGKRVFFGEFTEL